MGFGASQPSRRGEIVPLLREVLGVWGSKAATLELEETFRVHFACIPSMTSTRYSSSLHIIPLLGIAEVGGIILQLSGKSQK